MDRKIRCTACGYQLDVEGGICPKCGSEEYTVMLTVKEKLSLKERIGGKVREEGVKKLTKEFLYGADYSKQEHKYMEKERVIDRKNNIYHEKVTDPDNGNVVHKCDEPLTEHFGHGSAKNK